MKIDVLYQDDALLAASEPPGILVHRSPEARGDPHYMLQLVRDQVGQLVYPVHRLDRNTSGVLLFALGPAKAHALQERLAEPSSHKDYLVLVRGSTEASRSTESARPRG